MKHRYIVPKTGSLAVMAMLIGLLPCNSMADEQASIVASELTTIANQLSLNPDMAIDLSSVSGEYCFNTGLHKGGHMTHYAIDPTQTKEDVIDFVNAEPLIKSGMNVSGLPRFPGSLGSMTPNQWYFLPAGEHEPHHGRKFPFPLLMKASDIK